MYVSNNWQGLERLNRDHIATLLAEAEQHRKLPRLSLRRRIALWLKEWAEKLESEPYWVREGKASYG
ncbi:MAG TPA: hypothetical protein VFS50_03680 [Meiothermus sp.]|jgi:hypothetical protein|nr:hypothetical protein [Meiothermus sp.]